MPYDLSLNLQRFADAGTVVNTTANYINSSTGTAEEFSETSTLSPLMKTLYDTELLENARAKMVFEQFARKQPLPAHRGKTVEWRKWNTLPNASVLTEGVVPTGERLGESTMTDSLAQYGIYVTISDQLQLHAVDNVLLGASVELGASAAKTSDELIRNDLVTGTNVLFADAVDTTDGDAYVSTPTGRFGLTMTATAMCKLTPDMVAQAAAELDKNNTPTIDGYYVAVIHPSVAYDLRKSSEWIDYHKHADTKPIFKGEIGELHGVRFVKTTQAKIDAGATLLDATTMYLTVAAYTGADTTDTGATAGEYSAYRVTVSDTLTGLAAGLVGRRVHFMDDSATGDPLVGTGTVAGVDETNKYIWLKAAPPVTLASGDRLYPGEGGDCKAAGVPNVAVYSTLFMGADAFGTIDPEGGGLRMIIHPESDAGGPLDQFSTAGYKMSTNGAKILFEERIVRVESISSASKRDAAN